MKLAQLFSIYPQLRWGDSALKEVAGITTDSRKVEENYVYIAIRGTNIDGHNFIPSCIDNGASALVVEDYRTVPESFKGAVLEVNDTREAFAAISTRYFGHPAKKLFNIGVTGTNGKTSVCYMVECIFNYFGWPMGVLGTIDHHLLDKKWESQLTTPDPLTLNMRLKQFVDLGAKGAAFEVSSHALKQKRADHIPFDTVIFTNLTQDHLDYHPDMEDYFLSKQRLFNEVLQKHLSKTPTAIINEDDEYARRLEVAGHSRRITYGQSRGDLRFKILNQGFFGSEALIEAVSGSSELHLSTPGLHNLYNACAAIAAGMSAGISVQTCCEALASFVGIPGRLERVQDTGSKHVFVDYAHTEDALKSVLKTLQSIKKESATSGKIITVFGCGGDRDRGKRPKMAKVANKYSDYVFVTSDNPRSEPPEQIIGEVLAGIPSDQYGQKVFHEVDRKQAIHRALQMAAENDVILIAGKGHENYQILGDQTIEFSDVNVAKEFFG